VAENGLCCRDGYDFRRVSNVCEGTRGDQDGSDTMSLEFKVGCKVCCAVGELKGIKGEIVAHRANGHILVRVAEGVYVELPRFCVRKDES